MPSIPNISFSVRFNLTGAPTLVLTDTSTNGLSRVASFEITQPDGYTRPADILNPDLQPGQMVFSTPLRMDSNFNPQCGTYIIKMVVRVAGYDDTTFTRQWVSQYKPVAVAIQETYDVFTPYLSVGDFTNYTVTNYTNGPITRAWSIYAVGLQTTITGSGVDQSFAIGGLFYSDRYNTSLTSSTLYTHQTYPWFTINESVYGEKQACIMPPPTFVQFVQDISELRDKMNSNTCEVLEALKEDFEYAQSLLMHIIDKIKVDDMEDIYTDLNDLLRVLAGNQVPVCNPTLQPIPKYNIGDLDGTAWGTITGNIQNQTDLWAILSDLINKTGQATESVRGIAELATQAETDAGIDDLRIVTPLKLKTLLDNRVGGYAVNIGNGTSTSFALTHGLNTRDVIVAIYKVSTNEQVYVDVAATSTSVVTVTFGTAPASNSYRVVIKK